MPAVGDIREVYRNLMELTGKVNSSIFNLQETLSDDIVDDNIISQILDNVTAIKVGIELAVQKLKIIDEDLTRENWDGD